EAAGDVDVLLLDKTGTITLGNRQAVEFHAEGVPVKEVAQIAMLASLSDETPEGKSIVTLAREKYALSDTALPKDAQFVPFTAQTRMSGINMNGTEIRKGAFDAIATYVAAGTPVPDSLREVTDNIARQGGTPLLVAKNQNAVGVIHLKDIVKAGIKERFG